MKDRLIITRVGVMTMRAPVGRGEVHLHVADGQLRVGLIVFAKTDDRAGEIRPASVIPKSGLNNFDGATIVRAQHRRVELLEPKRLRLHLRRRGDRLLAQGAGRAIIMRATFHCGNLIPSEVGT
jgi:hypothetical protein